MLAGCERGGPPEIAIGMDACSSCGMLITEANQASAYDFDREMYPFCSPGCLLRGVEARRRAALPPPDAVYVADFESGELVRGTAATFVLTDRVPTVMDWGILAFADPGRAAAFRQEDEPMVEWQGLRRLRGAIDRTIELVVRPEGLEPEIVEVEKDTVSEWVVRGSNLETDLALVVRGYEEIGEIVVPATGEPVRVRLLSSKPGQGFPIQRTADGAILGQLRVRGAHTADEAVR